MCTVQPYKILLIKLNILKGFLDLFYISACNKDNPVVFSRFVIRLYSAYMYKLDKSMYMFLYDSYVI